jgi:Anti-sigma factor NepR
MRTNRTPDEWNKWCSARERIDEELKKYYQACTTEELPARLVELLKKLDHELPEKQNQ